MSRRVLLALPSLLLSALFLAGNPASAQRYTITSVGPATTTATAINNNGQIVGALNSGSATAPVSDPYLSTSGTVKDLGSLGAATATGQAYAINSVGQVVGLADGPFLYSAGKLSLLPGGVTPLGINKVGSIVGYWNPSGIPNLEHAFLYSNGVVKDLGFPNLNSSALGINTAGQIAGWTFPPPGTPWIFVATIWQPGGQVDFLGTLGGMWSRALAINDLGQVTGQAAIAGITGTAHAFLWTSGQMVDIDTLGSTYSFGLAINSHGVVVGREALNNQTSLTYHAFIYTSGKMTDLNSLIPAGTGWILHEATGINDSGEIVGNGTLNGQVQGFLLKPVITNNTPIRHVIMLIQENRTPDNLFGSDFTNSPRRLPNAHLVQHGSCHGASITLTPSRLDTCYDPDHGHGIPHPSWLDMYDNGKMDGACDIFIHNSCSSLTPLPANPTYTYVDNTPIPGQTFGIVEPYFQIAERYGFANQMFQTNQGPSFPAHQFLFTGTSAPTFFDDPNDPQMLWQWFAAENLSSSSSVPNGCLANPGALIYELAPNGMETAGYTPAGQTPGYPCYEHATLTDLLEQSKPQPISWRYYGNVGPGSLWNAPNAINHICKPSGGVCTGTDWTNGNVALGSGQILNDIANCRLREVSWVIPDGNWSDHPGTAGADAGPSWVAAIVNAIGNSWTNSNHKCDYWGNNSNDATAVLITWDDWGGFYDDVNPAAAIGLGYKNGGGNGQQYVYGFRVPLLVVSAYAKPSYTSSLNHDFGSMLNFTEFVFGHNGKSLGEINPAYHYADFFVQDKGAAPNNYSLYDFFNFSSPPQKFVPVTGTKYAPACFTNPTGCFTAFPMAPDKDAEEDD